MQINKGMTVTWVPIYAAIIGVTSYIPLIPYITGGGFLPLSISLAAVAPLILGFGPGVLSALVGGLIGMFLNPATYPFGLVDAFFVGMAPAIFCGFAFKGSNQRFRIAYVVILILSGIFAELVPYYYPGAKAGFGVPPWRIYSLLIAFFFIPWVILYVSPLGTKLISKWVSSKNIKFKFVGVLIGILIGLIPWSLWMIAPAALVLKFAPELAIATWVFAAYSRVLLAVIATVIIVPLLIALERSGMPAPTGAIWQSRR